MRKNASMVVQSISGHRGKSCYYVLTQAVTVAVLCMPSEPQMKVICTEAGRLCGKSTAAVWKALSRALDDIWQCGDREALTRALGYTPQEKPSPRDLVLSLACHLWCSEKDEKESQ